MSKVNSSTPSALQLSNISQIKLFIKSNFLGYSDPSIVSQKKLKTIRYNLKTDVLAKKYLTKDLAFSKQFIISLTYIHQYMKAFRENLSFDDFFKTEEFPLFLLNQFSSPSQLEMHSTLTDPEKIKSHIAENGLKKTKNILKDIFLDYKISFSSEQIYQIQKILDLGTDFQIFLQYDLTNLILILYPAFFQDENLQQLKNNYQKLSLHYLNQELELFIGHLASLKSNNNYYEFIELYGHFLNLKVINKKEFRNFFAAINEFIGNNLLLNVLQVQENNELISALPPQPKFTKPNVPSILKEISAQTYKNHHIAVRTFVKDMEDATLNYMFDKQTIQQIKYQQNKIDHFLKKQNGEKSITSISLVLMAFSEKIFYKNIQPSLEFLIKNTIFVLPEFKKDLIYYFQATLKIFQSAKNNIQQARQVIQSSTGLFSGIEIKSKEICQDFLANTEALDALLNTIITIGKEELKNKVQFIIPTEKMEKLIKNIQISRTLIQKIYQYIQISFQTNDIF